MTNYPHKCPECQSPAYVGFTRVECSAPEAKCRHSDGKASPFHGATFKDPFDLGVAAALWAKAQSAGFGQLTAATKPALAASPACPDCGSTNVSVGGFKSAGAIKSVCWNCGSVWVP